MVRLIMQVMVSIALMGAAMYVMVWQAHDTDPQRWASGMFGAIMAFCPIGGFNYYMFCCYVREADQSCQAGLDYDASFRIG